MEAWWTHFNMDLVRFLAGLGFATCLLLFCATLWAALLRIPAVASLPAVEGHGGLSDETASSIRHLMTSRVYISLLMGLLLNVAAVVHALSIFAPLRPPPAAIALDPSSFWPYDGLYIFVQWLCISQLAVCAVASCFNGRNHFKTWRAITKADMLMTAAHPGRGTSTEEQGSSAAGGLDPEHEHLVRLGSTQLARASKLPAFLCSTLACGSLLIAFVVSLFLTSLHIFFTYEGVRSALMPTIKGGFLTVAVVVSGILSRMVLSRCVFNEQQHKTEGEVLPMRRPALFAWFECCDTLSAVGEGIWVGLSRLLTALMFSTASLLRPDKPTHNEALVKDKVFRSYAAVVAFERDAEACRRRAGASHFESGVSNAVVSKASCGTGLRWLCLFLVAAGSPYALYYIVLAAVSPPSPPPPPSP